MSDALFRMYPRGYLGDAGNTPITRKRDNTMDFLKAVREGSTGPSQYKMLGAPNQVVDILYQDLVLTPNNMERFAWREQLLTAALKAFGTDSLSTWLTAQHKSPYYGKHHNNFVSDCLRFARGDSRTQAISSWDMLVTDDDTGPSSGAPALTDSLASGVPARSTIVDLVHSWVSKPGGYSDLAISLYILFGRYDGIY